VDQFSRFFQRTGFQPLANHPNERFVVHPLLQHAAQPVVIDVVEEPLVICLDHPMRSSPKAGFST